MKILYNRATVMQEVTRVAQQISTRYANKELVLLMMLRGGVMFGVDLSRVLFFEGQDLEIDFMNISLNDDDGTRREPRFLTRPVCRIQNRPVLVVDDSLGSGETYLLAKSWLLGAGAASVEIAVVVNCYGKWEKKCQPDYFCFAMHDADHYRVGYGEDINGKLREIPFMAEYPEDEFFRVIKSD